MAEMMVEWKAALKVVHWVVSWEWMLVVAMVGMKVLQLVELKVVKKVD